MNTSAGGRGVLDNEELARSIGGRRSPPPCLFHAKGYDESGFTGLLHGLVLVGYHGLLHVTLFTTKL
jgi:hypothetical protein